MSNEYLTQSEIYNQVETSRTSGSNKGETQTSKNIATLVWLKARKYSNKFIAASLGLDQNKMKYLVRSMKDRANKQTYDYYIHQLTIFTPKELFNWALRNNINPSFQPPYITLKSSLIV